MARKFRELRKHGRVELRTHRKTGISSRALMEIVTRTGKHWLTLTVPHRRSYRPIGYFRCRPIS